MRLKTLLRKTTFIPVITIDSIDSAVPLAKALMKGGLHVLEITLRTPAALEVIQAISQTLPQCQIGAGTVTEPRQFEQIRSAGANFAVSPASTKELITAAQKAEMPFLPGVSTCTEILNARQLGCQILKFFPAHISGGANALKYFASLFTDVEFCPTGGVEANNMQDYLSLPNVICVGGSWVTPNELIQNKDWAKITHLARETTGQHSK